MIMITDQFISNKNGVIAIVGITSQVPQEHSRHSSHPFVHCRCYVKHRKPPPRSFSARTCIYFERVYAVQMHATCLIVHLTTLSHCASSSLVYQPWTRHSRRTDFTFLDSHMFKSA